MRHFASSTQASKQAKTTARALERLGFNPLGYRVAIFGRPNVGKSTLFNRLVGRALAIVDNKPGVTRDRREADATVGELEFRLVDTAGLEEVQSFLANNSSDNATQSRASEAAALGEYQLINREPLNKALQEEIAAQTALAIAECDVALFVIDGREGVTPLDRHFARWLRRQCNSTKRVTLPDGSVRHERTSKPVVLLANKCDNAEQEASYHGLTEGWELGFGEPVAISADHAAGMSGLHNALYAAMLEAHPRKEAEFAAREAMLNAEAALLPSLRHIRLAVVGKVNTGKSTLVNTLLGSQRLLTGSQPGVTRDAVEVEWRDAVEERKEEELLKRRLKAEQDDDEGGNEGGAEPVLSGKERRERREAEARARADADAEGEVDPDGKSSPSTPAAPLIPSYRFTLVDTAGLKGVTSHAHSKYSRVDSLAMGLSLKAIERANVVALVIDISEACIDGVQRVGEDQDVAEPAASPKAAAAGGSNPRAPSWRRHAKVDLAKAESRGDSVALHSLLFKPGRRYTEQERTHLLRTFVRNVFSAADLAIAAKVLAEGRAILILLNKFDLVPPGPLRSQILEGVAVELQTLLPSAGGGVQVLGISGAQSYDALRGQPLKTTLRQNVISVFERWSKRVPTHRLNQWLIELLKFHPPPPVREAGGVLRKTSLKFLQQVSTGPPTFVLFANKPGEELPDEYRRFLANGLRKEFDLGGVPLRLFERVRTNPYLDPSTKVAARAKQAKEEGAVQAALPSFAEGEIADADEDSSEEFREADYAREGKEVRFDYDADPQALHMRSAEAVEEIKREAAVREQMKQVPIDSPIPRVAPGRAASAAAASSAPRGRMPKVNTSSIFASTRTVASKPGRNTGVTASSRWSLGRPPLPGSKKDSGAFPKKQKEFGTRKAKAKGPSGTVQSGSVHRTTEKADSWDQKRKEATKNKKIAAKSRKQSQSSAAPRAR